MGEVAGSHVRWKVSHWLHVWLTVIPAHHHVWPSRWRVHRPVVEPRRDPTISKLSSLVAEVAY